MQPIPYSHVDVFAPRPYTGNSLAVFVDPPDLTSGQLAAITGELRHFETIFVSTGAAPGSVTARVFDLDGELAFAGHPVLGAAAVLHGREDPGPGVRLTTSVALPARTVTVETEGSLDTGVLAALDQGRPDVLETPPRAQRPAIAAAVGLTAGDLDDELPAEVLSTGLRYLIIPVRSADALARARIHGDDFARFLDGLGAEFAYLLDAAGLEGRHWNNDGIIEDVATGSAAGCVAAYLMRHGRARDGEALSLRQGRFAGRPSQIQISAFGDARLVDRVVVAGRVSLVATGHLHAPPPA
ncbi:MAG TPA: PhzF family phenazine biosynthesis protein [Streptosporangiaceae bacterium]|nr:PhzF family phenazine biosynthesis protein [Streptosporangiaceae bacterium]